MAYVITHFLTSTFLATLFRAKFSEIQKYIHVKELFIIGLFGVIPDIDVLPFIINSYFDLGWPNIHRLITHNFVIVAAIFLIGLLLYTKNKKIGLILMLGSIGWASHVTLDWILSGTVTPFYPLSSFETGINLIPAGNLRLGTYVLSGIDAVVLLTWSWFAITKKKLVDFQVW